MKNLTSKSKSPETQPTPLACAITILVNSNKEISYSVTPNEVPIDIVIEALDVSLNSLVRQRREALAKMEVEKQNDSH